MNAEDLENQCNTDDIPLSKPSSTSNIFKKFQKLYAHQLKETDDTSEGLKLKVKILENWVEDLTEQNVMLVQTVDELETEALKRLSMLEANLSQTGQGTTATNCTSGTNTVSSKGLNCQIESLCHELEQMKRQLSDKEKLISKYQSRIEELGSCFEGEKADECNKHRYSKTESICGQDHNVQPSVYREETLVEVLGIKERSLSHLEHLTEQLEQKDQVISCLKQQLTQGSSELLYRVRQQVEWFTENVTQQCNQGNCSEEFKKCITTMLEELKESIECCNLGPSDTTELSKGSNKFGPSFQKCLEQSKKELCQSWASISDTVHQMNKMDLSSLVDQWKKGLCKQKSMQHKLQEVVRSIINITSSSNVNVESITKSMDSLQCLLLRFADELNNQPRERSFTGWLKNLHCLVSDVISKIQEITEIICAIRSSDDKTHSDLVRKIQMVDSLQLDINDALCTEMKVYEKLSKKEKSQRVKADTLLATVLHHEDIWNQQLTLTDELMKEILRLSEIITKNVSNQKQFHYNTQIPIEERCLHLQSLVSKISADIKKSLCDIEQRQNQVSRLELDLSSVRLVLESAQMEIDEISKTCNTQDVKRKVTILLLKLKKQIANALTKANTLVKTYAITKQEYLCSSGQIIQLQKDWHVLENEVRCHWTQLCKDFKKPPITDQWPCATQAVLERYEKKCPGSPLNNQFIGVQKALQKEHAAIKNVKENVMDLKLNVRDRDKLTDTQDKTICVLQNSLKICNKEVEELQKQNHFLEVRKCEIEVESKKKIQELKTKILELQNCLKKYEEVNKNHQKTEESLKTVIASLKESGFKQAETEKSHQEQMQKLMNKICELQKNMKLCEDISAKHQKSEAALQLVIANLKETICKERKTFCETQKENKKLREKVKELEDCSKNTSKLNKETADEIKDLESQVKCCSKKVSDLESKLKNVQEKLCKSLQREKELELELCSKKELEECSKNTSKLNKETAEKIKDLESQIKCWSKKTSDLQCKLKDIQEKLCKSLQREKELEAELYSKKELEECSKNTSKLNTETANEIKDLESQVKCWSKKVSELECKLKNIQEKLCKSLQREKELELELSSKDLKYKEEICKKQKEIFNLTNAIQSLTERLSESSTELDATRVKTCETELKLQSICGAYEDLKVKEREKEVQADKLQLALTQLSNKFVSRRLDTGTSHYLRHYQEECAKYEALYNTTACKLRSKEVEISSLKQEVEHLRSELDHVTMTTSQQKEDEGCPFLMERVHQLSKELQVAHSCQNSYESLLKDIREKYSKKEEENCQLKTQIKQITLQRDTILADLEQAQIEINRLKINNSNLHTTNKRLEHSSAQVSEQLHKVMYDSDQAGAPQLQPNIELQREISTALSSQLRGVKQKLHTTKHDYKLLQAAYEDLNRKYTTLQRGEHDLVQVKAITPTAKPLSRCRPCLAKSSKSVTYFKMPEKSKDAQDPIHLGYLSHSKSWHKVDNDKDLEWKETKWKQKLQNVIRGDFGSSEVMRHSSSSN